MRGIHNFHGASLEECSVRSGTQGALFAMLSTLSPTEIQRRISDIEDPDIRILAQAHADAFQEVTDDWSGPIKE